MSGFSKNFIDCIHNAANKFVKENRVYPDILLVSPALYKRMRYNIDVFHELEVLSPYKITNGVELMGLKIKVCDFGNGKEIFQVAKTGDQVDFLYELI